MPYRDFAVEYPPGALPVFALPSLVAGRGDFRTYSRVFEALMGLCGIAAAVAVALVAARWASRLRLVVAVAVTGLAPLALGPVVLSRFDLWPAALTAFAVASLVLGRRRAAFSFLALGFAAKLFPAVLLPPAIAYVWRRRGRREACVCAAWFAAVAAIVFAPFVALAPHGMWTSVAGQATRPLQIETIGASLLLAAHHAAGTSVTVGSSHGSDNLIGVLPHAFASVQAILQLLALVAVWVVFARGPATTDRLLRASAASVAAFIAFGKVLSPQYLVWLIPLVPLVRGRRGVYASLLLVAALVLTQLWFPYRYLGLVVDLDPVASWLVLARDLSLVALFLVLVPVPRPKLWTWRPRPTASS